MLTIEHDHGLLRREPRISCRAKPCGEESSTANSGGEFGWRDASDLAQSDQDQSAGVVIERSMTIGDRVGGAGMVRH